MKRLVVVLAAILSVATVGALGQNAPSRFELASKHVQARYSIEVVMPRGTAPPGTKYPAVYCLDWHILGDYLKSLPGLMELGRLTEPFILVGIGQGSTDDDWASMRTRDYTPAPPKDEYSLKYTYAPALKQAGGAPEFAAFLRDELMTAIESRFPADPKRRCLAGYSLGGLLGVYILATDPGAFQYYLLGSVSLWFNDFYLGPEIAKVAPERLAAVGKIYLSVGEEEDWEMIKGYDLLRKAFREKGFDASRLKTEIIPNSGHVGAMPTALYNGLRFLFRR